MRIGKLVGFDFPSASRPRWLIPDAEMQGLLKPLSWCHEILNLSSPLQFTTRHEFPPIRVMQAFCFEKSQVGLTLPFHKPAPPREEIQTLALSRKITHINSQIKSLYVTCKLKFAHLVYMYATLFSIAVLFIFIVILNVFLSVAL